MKEYRVKVYEDRTCWFNLEELYHREDGPAVEWNDGAKSWYLNGKRHRIDGPAIEYSNGSKEWFINGLLHREDGPAIEHIDGSKAWYQYGKIHREDGPAVEGVSGTKYWYINGEQLSEQEFNEMITLKRINNKIVEIDGYKYKLIEI